MADKIPIIAIVIRSSIRVKPSFLMYINTDVIFYLKRSNTVIR